MDVLKDSNGEPVPFNYDKLRTFTGLTIPQALAKLQEKLDDNAYKKVTGGGKELTDIKPAWLTEALTTVFGIVGVGWYYDFDEPVVIESEKLSSSGRKYTSFQADILKGKVVYRLTDGVVIYESEPIYATGGSDNEVKEYAIRGALTNMLGAASSKLEWQLFIYKGEKDLPPKKEATKATEKDESVPWYWQAIRYAKSKPEVWKEPLGSSEFGNRVIARMVKELIGKDNGWWDARPHFDKAIQAYTGFKVPEDMTWDRFERLVRIYRGPLVHPGETIKDVLFYHYLKPSEWQRFLAAIPLDEEFVLDDKTAAAIQDILINAPNYLKDKKLGVETMADQVRNHFVKIAEVVSPTSDELVEAVGKQDEIPY